ncbi:hypothetical protein PTE30175_05370 [Pandoraea terrae]|uniref:Uncharacterized protein n=1 Tax=Pandoraea terrae TaxID=1537710 RepID=A0A5E4ZDE5_9BURK|nr:hypothetical protein PTE30175_05370 [Pandoraea terrae]
MAEAGRGDVTGAAPGALAPCGTGGSASTPPASSGVNAAMRSSAIEKPVYSSGASPNSLRARVAI